MKYSKVLTLFIEFELQNLHEVLLLNWFTITCKCSSHIHILYSGLNSHIMYSTNRLQLHMIFSCYKFFYCIFNFTLIFFFSSYQTQQHYIFYTYIFFDYTITGFDLFCETNFYRCCTIRFISGYFIVGFILFIIFDDVLVVYLRVINFWQ